MRKNVIIVLLTVAVSVAWAREYRVSPTGNDHLRVLPASPCGLEPRLP